MRQILFKFIGAQFVFGLSLAEAKTLYIDLNHTENEIAIFKADAATESDFILLPRTERREYFLDQGRQIAKLKDRLEKLQKLQISKYGCRDTGGYKGPHKILDCRSAHKDFASVNGDIAEVDQQLDKLNRYHARDLRLDLFELEKQLKDLPLDQQLDRVVISGHQDKQDFYGDMAWMSDQELSNVLRAFSGSMFKNVKSVFLLGCKTIQEDMLLQYWVPAFGNAFQFSGYDQTGYLSDSSHGNSMLKEIVKRQRTYFSAAMSGDEKAKVELLKDDPRLATSFVTKDEDAARVKKNFEFFKGRNRVRKFFSETKIEAAPTKESPAF